MDHSNHLPCCAAKHQATRKLKIFDKDPTYLIITKSILNLNSQLQRRPLLLALETSLKSISASKLIATVVSLFDDDSKNSIPTDSNQQRCLPRTDRPETPVLRFFIFNLAPAPRRQQWQEIFLPLFRPFHQIALVLAVQ